MNNIFFFKVRNSLQSNKMERLSLVVQYDEYIRHMLDLLDTTVERGT